MSSSILCVYILPLSHNFERLKAVRRPRPIIDISNMYDINKGRRRPLRHRKSAAAPIFQ